jgi:CRP/FNR family transcriptional regulator, polysaccharide utilization system transcription regulator
MSDKEFNNDLPSIETSSECFQFLSEEELALLEEKKKKLIYASGENLFKQGAFAPYVMYVIDGLVRVFLQTGPDKQVNIRLAHSGDFLAFTTIFGQNVYSYSAVAVKESTICMIDKSALSEVLLKNPEFAMRITSRNARHEMQLFEIIKNISYKQMRGKLASALIYLSDEELIKEDVFQHLTRQDIADFASISAESTIKFLKEFEKEGIIALNGKDIRILDVHRLDDMAKRG